MSQRQADCGSGWGNTLEAHEVAHDEKRTLFLSEQGWVVHRVWNDDVFKERNAVCDGILLALSAR